VLAVDDLLPEHHLRGALRRDTVGVMTIFGSFPIHGEVEWIATDSGGRKHPPTGPTYATVAWRETVGPDEGLASFVLRGFAPTGGRSHADGRWLFPQSDPACLVSPPEVIIIAEGKRPVARFYVDAVDDAVTTLQRIEGWLRQTLQHARLAEDDESIITEFLDHNELGLAFEHMVELLAERDAPLARSDLEALGSAAWDMALTDNTAWKHLIQISPPN
jgi:hypothetical protein